MTDLREQMVNVLNNLESEAWRAWGLARVAAAEQPSDATLAASYSAYLGWKAAWERAGLGPVPWNRDGRWIGDPGQRLKEVED